MLLLTFLQPIYVTFYLNHHLLVSPLFLALPLVLRSLVLLILVVRPLGDFSYHLRGFCRILSHGKIGFKAGPTEATVSE